MPNPGNNLKPALYSMPEDLAGIPPRHEPDQATAPDAPPTWEAEFGGFIGTSEIMLGLYERIQNAARSQATVFITGESGTGKEVCAQAVHKYSSRAKAPFIPVNCTAIPRDLLESELFGHVRGAFTDAVSEHEGAVNLAHGGTLFLDEIGELDPQMQTKLLRFLQDGTFQRVGANKLERADCRIICATSRDPLIEIGERRFRQDLYYRLHVIPIDMPPLRQRGDDVVDIALTLLLRYAQEEGKRFRGFTAETESLIRRYEWPGNIRQLQNVIRNITVMHDGMIVGADLLPPPLHEMLLGAIDGSTRKLILPLEQVERNAIEEAIRACSGNIPRAAAMLKVSPSTIYRKKASWAAGGRKKS